MVSAFLRKNGGVSFRKTQETRPATIAKLIHLKISLARSVVALPPSSAACAPTAAKSKITSAPARSFQTPLRVIEPLPQDRRRAAAQPAAHGARFPPLTVPPKT